METAKLKTSGGSDFLFIDIGCQLFIQCPGIPDRIKSYLVGLVRGGYLIVSTPETSGAPALRRGIGRIITRYIFRGEVLGFQSSVIATIEKPFRLTFLSYPDSVERMNLRKGKRIDCNLPSRLTFESKDITGIISDLSGGGCKFTARLNLHRAKINFAVDSPVNVAFSLPGSQAEFHIGGTIRNCGLSADRAELGIQFVKISREYREKIDAYVQQVSDFT
jgi:hypothetical protein